MPYYVHPKTEDVNPEKHPCFTERKTAHETTNNETDLTVSFVISEGEKIEWRRREWQRFQDGVYTLPPWISVIWRLWEPYDDLGRDDYGHYNPVAHHFAHTSLKTPGCVAYTPSDEHGYQDRQVTLKVGRYLEQFCTSWMTPETIASYVAQVKSYSSNLQIARTPGDVVAVYRNGPESCMSHDIDDYTCGSHHPCEVYGDSDLGVAYLGTIDNVSARALVWPDRKLHSRVYGDRTLHTVLKNAGYTEEKMDYSFGVFDGAKIRAIRLDTNRYVMPYLDCTSDHGMRLDEDREYFVLTPGREDDHRWITQNTDGFTNYDRYPCSRDGCEDYADEDGGYCESCDDDRVSCCRCDDVYFDTDDMVAIDDDWYCTSCANHYRHECAHCEREWYEVSPDSEYCENCRSHLYECTDCDDAVDARNADDPDHRRCDNCYAEYVKESEDTDDGTDDTDTDSPSPLVYPTISNDLTVPVETTAGTRVQSETVHLTGIFGVMGVHARASSDRASRAYVVTHIPTGRQLQSFVTYEAAVRTAVLLSTPGIDWAELDSAAFPIRDGSLKDFALYVLRNGDLPADLSAYECYRATSERESVCPSV